MMDLRLQVTVCIKKFSWVTSYLYLHKGSRNKNENIASMVIKAAGTAFEATFLLRKSGHGRAMTAIVTIFCVKFYLDKGF